MDRIASDLYLKRKINNHYETFKKLKIESSKDEMESVYEKFKVIQLRPYNNEKHLVIACGNRPLYHNHKECEHLDCYTIDISPRQNPSLIARFGYDDIRSLFKESSFETILIEFCSENVFETEMGVLCLIHLLKDGGYLLYPKTEKYTTDGIQAFIPATYPMFKRNGMKLEFVHTQTINLENKEDWNLLKDLRNYDDFTPMHDDYKLFPDKFKSVNSKKLKVSFL